MVCKNRHSLPVHEFERGEAQSDATYGHWWHSGSSLAVVTDAPLKTKQHTLMTHVTERHARQLMHTIRINGKLNYTLEAHTMHERNVDG